MKLTRILKRIVARFQSKNFEENRYSLLLNEVPPYVYFSTKGYGICSLTNTGYQPNVYSESLSRFLTLEPDTIVRTLNRADEFRWDNGAF